MNAIHLVCTANQFRSPLAAACFRKGMEEQRADGKWVIESAGTWARDGLPAARIAVQAARQLGVHGLYGHRTRQIHGNLLDRFDLIIVMERGHKEALCSEFPSACARLYLLSEVVDQVSYDIPDPVDSATDPYAIGRELSTLITRGKEKISQLAESLGKSRSPQ